MRPIWLRSFKFNFPWPPGSKSTPAAATPPAPPVRKPLPPKPFPSASPSAWNSAPAQGPRLPAKNHPLRPCHRPPKTRFHCHKHAVPPHNEPNLKPAQLFARAFMRDTCGFDTFPRLSNHETPLQRSCYPVHRELERLRAPRPRPAGAILKYPECPRLRLSTCIATPIIRCWTGPAPFHSS